MNDTPKKKSHPLEFDRDDDDPAADQNLPGIVTEATEPQVQQLITPLKNFEQQIGEHVMRALAVPNTVAVLTAVVIGPDGQQNVVSAALNPDMMQQVQEMLSDAAQQRKAEMPCVGFQCFIDHHDDKKNTAPDDNQ